MPDDAPKSSGLMTAARDTLTDPKMLKLILAAGGASALAGGYLTAKTKKKGLGNRPEDPAARRKRIIRNALLTGYAGAGAAGLIGTGVNSIDKAIPANEKTDAWTGLLENNQGLLGTGAVGAGAYTGGRLVGTKGLVNDARNTFMDYANKVYAKSDDALRQKIDSPLKLDALLASDRSTRQGMVDAFKQDMGSGAPSILRNAGMENVLSNTKAMQWLKSKMPEALTAKAGAPAFHISRAFNSLIGSGKRMAGAGAGAALALYLQQKFLNPENQTK